MRNIFLFVVYFITISVYSQKVKYSYHILDSETSEPVVKAFIYLKNFEYLGPVCGTDKNGLTEFKISNPVDSIDIFHISYKPKTVKLEPEGIVYIEPMICQLGTLKMYDFEIDSDLNCPSLNYLPEIDLKSLVSDWPKYSGGLLCFDKYVYNEIIRRRINIDLAGIKKLKLIFNITDTGTVENIQLDKILPDNVRNAITQIFLNSSNWIPAHQVDYYVQITCSYNIRFKK